MKARKAVALLLALGGCELIADIPSTSSASGDDAPVADGGGSDGPTNACASELDCAAPTGLCLLPAGSCVACLVNADCEGATPICDADHTCQACTEDAACGSGVCLLDGACADPARILHAAPTGSGIACTTTAPCTIDTAVSRLSAIVDVIKLAPAVYDRAQPVTFNATAAVLAGTGATLHGVPSGGGGMFPDLVPLIAVTGGNLTVTGLTFDAAGKFGVTCATGATTLSRVTIQGGLLGLFANMGCGMTIERSRFTGNALYGAYMADGTTFAIRNSLFVTNGSATSTSAALIVSQSTGTVEHTTFAANASDGTKGAIDCVDGTPPTIRGIISVGHATTLPAACPVSYSDIEAGYAGPGTNNVTLDPLFVDAATGNYHLQPTSPVRGLGDPASTLATDLDGEARPQPAATARDLGADEVP